MSVTEALIGEVAEINPSADAVPSDMEVAFMPMAAVSAESSTAIPRESRMASELSGGLSYFQNNDVLVAKITPCFENGKIAQAHITQEHGFGSTEFHVLRAKDAQLYARYLLHFLRQGWVSKEGERRMTGSAGQRRVPKHFLEHLTIPLPPLSEQRRIAAILDKAEALRAKRRQALATIDDLLPSAFDEMFENTNPKGEFKPLHELANIASGVAKGRRLNGRAVEAKYLRVANVQAGYLDLNEIKTIEALPEEVENLRLIHGDVLLTEGGDFDKLGRGAMWTGDIEDCIHQNHVFRVRVNRHLLLPEYFHHFLQGPSARAYFLKCAKRTTNLASINMTQLKTLPTLIPPMAQQREFVKLASASLNRRRAHDLSAKRLDSLFASLQHRAFRGEL